MKKSKKVARHILIGKKGEKYAAKYLKRNYYSIWEQNWNEENIEVDLICSYQSTLIFFEVKTRKYSEDDKWNAIDAVDSKQQIRIKKAAELFAQKYYLKLKRKRIHSLRFDIIVLNYKEKNPSYTFELKHFPDAFSFEQTKYQRAR